MYSVVLFYLMIVILVASQRCGTPFIPITFSYRITFPSLPHIVTLWFFLVCFCVCILLLGICFYGCDIYIEVSYLFCVWYMKMRSVFFPYNLSLIRQFLRRIMKIIMRVIPEMCVGSMCVGRVMVCLRMYGGNYIYSMGEKEGVSPISSLGWISVRSCGCYLWDSSLEKDSNPNQKRFTFALTTASFSTSPSYANHLPGSKRVRPLPRARIYIYKKIRIH